MAKRRASLLSFHQSIYKTQRESEEKADDDQDQESDDSDRQDVQVDIPEGSDMNLNIHVMIHHIWCQHWAPKFLVISRPLK